MKRKLLSALTALALCLSLCPGWALAQAAEAGEDSGQDPSYQVGADTRPVELQPLPGTVTASGTFGDGFAWTLDDDGVLTITGAGAMQNWDTDEDRPWSDQESSITKVVIGSGVTTIGNYAFYSDMSSEINYYSNLTSVEISDSVTAIGEHAFQNLGSLTDVRIPDGVTSIETTAFFGCSSLTSVELPGSLTSIEDFVFHGCTGLTSVTIPDSVTAIGSYAFFECTGLTSVHIPAGVTNIGGGAFSLCTGLTEITVDEGNTVYSSQNGMLLSKEGDQLISCPVGVRSCVVPDGVTTIGQSAFEGCTELTGVTIPGSVTTIGNGVFFRCISLTEITVDEGNTVYSSQNGMLLSKEGDQLISCPVGVRSCVIPDGVTTIGQGAFKGCAELTGVTIPDSVTTIGNDAFSGCIGLAGVDIPDSVTSIGDSAFSGCTGLTSVHIPEGVTTIESGMFIGCIELTSVEIPDSVTTIGSIAFYNCIGLTSVTIPGSVTSIGGGAFYGCVGLKAVAYAGTEAEWAALIGGSQSTGLPGTDTESIKIYYDGRQPPVVTVIGSYAENSGAGVYHAGEEVTVKAGSRRDVVFVGWTAEGVELDEEQLSQAELTFTMPEGKVTLTANWWIPVTGVALDQNALSLEVGDTAQLTATVEPEEADNPAVTWTSSDPAVAEVDQTGKVTAKGEGAATITVTTEEGEKTAECTITVTKPSGPDTPDNPGTPSEPSTPSQPSRPSRPSGSGGSGGAAASTVPVSTSGQNNAAVATTTTATPTASTQNGTATVSVNLSVGSEIVNQAVSNNSVSVVIAPKATGNASKTEVSIPSSTVGQLGSRTNASLTVTTSVAGVTIPNGALDRLSSAGGNVTVAAERMGNTVEVTVTAGGNAIMSVNGGLTATVPVSNAGPGTVAVLVRADGAREVVRKSIVDNGRLIVPLAGSAKLEIVDNSQQFTDVSAGSWAEDAVAFVSARELFSGTEPGRFSPGLPMSRGMLAVVLHNLEDNPAQGFAGAFSDVSSGAWYAEGVAWAAARGIVTGYGDGRFGPGDHITREQLAVMLWRYAGSPVAANRELGFADAHKVGDWALDALLWATQKGVLNGKGGGILDPGGYATRAEAAQMLKNFVENL